MPSLRSPSLQENITGSVMRTPLDEAEPVSGCLGEVSFLQDLAVRGVMPVL
jgi:hypothetical protein